MADNVNKEFSISAEQSGKISFNNDVVSTIAVLATTDVEGVAGMSGSFTSGVVELLGRKNLTKGVKIEMGTEECALEINIIAQYGFNIREVCEKVQQSVKSSVEMMTGLRVVEVNVNVQGIVFEKKAAEEPAAATLPEGDSAR